MIIAGKLLLSDDDSREMKAEGGWLRIEGGRLAEVHVGECPHSPDLGGEGWVISPGFIDTHLHLPQFDSIGADGMPLLTWLDRVIFPAEARWADADFAGEMAARVARRLLAHGTTTVCAYATVHHRGTRNAIRSLAEAGLSGFVGQVLMDQQAPTELLRPMPQLLAEAASFEDVDRIRPIVTPRFAVSCSAELLKGAGALAAAKGWPVQTHLAETVEECELVRRLHRVDRYLEAYANHGLATPRTIYGHGIWISEADRRAIHAAGSTVAHCPTANIFLQAGAMDLLALDRTRVRASLGSDVAGGPDISMVRVGRAMIETAKWVARTESEQARRLNIPTPAHAWWRITAGNADALHMPDSGRILTGSRADLLVIHPTPEVWGATDFLGTLLYGWHNDWLCTVLCHGKTVLGL